MRWPTWPTWPTWLHLFSRIQEEKDRQAALLHEEPDEPLPGSDLSEHERHEALEREAERREQEHQRS